MKWKLLSVIFTKVNLSFKAKMCNLWIVKRYRFLFVSCFYFESKFSSSLIVWKEASNCFESLFWDFLYTNTSIWEVIHGLADTCEQLSLGWICSWLALCIFYYRWVTIESLLQPDLSWSSAALVYLGRLHFWMCPSRTVFGYEPRTL